ncbi:MAG: LysR family transcriptional regulator [Pseudomonadota bacterium]
MDWRSVRFDWNQARAFLVTAEEGSLSAAARALGMAQPTLGRQVRGLERSLGVALFERAGRGLVLTPTGRDLLVHLRAMAEAANAAALTASGRSETVEGLVSITTTEVAAAHMMPPILAELRARHPEITVELVVSNEINDLRRREADIAVRGGRPTDPDLIARRLGEGRAHLYAACAYLDTMGDPATPEEVAALDFVGFADTAEFLRGLHAWGLPVTDQRFRLRTANHLVQWEMIRAGLGVGVMPDAVGEPEPLVRRAAPWLAPFPFELWLVAHRELRTSRRVRIVFDLLAERVAAALSREAGSVVVSAPGPAAPRAVTPRDHPR